MSKQKLKEKTDNSFLTSKKKKQGKKGKAVGIVSDMYSKEMGNPFVKLKERWMILLCFLSGPLSVYVVYQGSAVCSTLPEHGCATLSYQLFTKHCNWFCS